MTPYIEFSDEDSARFARGYELFQKISNTPGFIDKLLGTPEQWATAWQQAGLPETFEADPGPEI
jgi:hypothetical protein